MIARLSVLLPTLGIAAAAAGLAAPYLRGLYLPLDLLTHFRIHFAGGLLACVLALLVGRYQLAVMTAGVAATVLAIGLQGRAAALLERPAAAPGEGERAVRVLAFNVWGVNREWRALAEIIRADDPDVAVLSEVNLSMRPLLEALKDRYPYRAACLDAVDCEMALLSKSRILEWRASSNPEAIVARLGDLLAGLTVVGVHPMRPPFLPVQLRHAEALARLVQGLGGRLVAAGDFNATPWSLPLTTFERMSGLTRLTSLPSWPAHGLALPQVAIDHIFVSSGIRPLGAATTLAPAGSDHLPVRVTLAVRQP